MINLQTVVGNFTDLDSVAYVTAASDGDNHKRFNKAFQMGLLSSALEHAIPEQMFSTEENPAEAISAVKALQKANAAGKRIYHITPDNQASILPHIHHNQLAMDEIRDALNAGKEVITHTNAVSVPGWSGAGYILFDPETGSGAYKIGGGHNGGFLKKVSKALGPAAAGFPLTKLLVALVDLLLTINTILDVIAECGMNLRAITALIVITAMFAGVLAILFNPFTWVGQFGGAGILSLTTVLVLQHTTGVILGQVKDSCR